MNSQIHDSVTIQQLRYIAKKFGAPLPPPIHLQQRVVDGYFSDWYQSGEIMFDRLNQCLQQAGKDMGDFTRILDFGCGSGRCTVPFHYRLRGNADIHATDIDGEAIAWCQANYGRIATFQVNDPGPPIRYPDTLLSQESCCLLT